MALADRKAALCNLIPVRVGVTFGIKKHKYPATVSTIMHTNITLYTFPFLGIILFFGVPFFAAAVSGVPVLDDDANDGVPFFEDDADDGVSFFEDADDGVTFFEDDADDGVPFFDDDADDGVSFFEDADDGVPFFEDDADDGVPFFDDDADDGVPVLDVTDCTFVLLSSFSYVLSMSTVTQ